MFRQRDQQAMPFAFDLLSYEDVQQHATAILDRLRAASMPGDGESPDHQIDLFHRSVHEGAPP